jgi:phosphohistidine phosphatase SixA
MKTSRMVLSFRRHADPKKDAMGKSLDELSDEGIEQAKEVGRLLIVPDGGMTARCSPMKRAYDTTMYMLNSAEIRGYTAKRDPLLSPIAVASETFPKLLLDEAGKKRTWNEAINLMMKGKYMDDTDETFESAGKRIYRMAVGSFTLLCDGQEKGTEARVEHISHSPVVDSGLITLLNTTRKKPIQNIEQIGGMFNPCENFTLTLDYQWGEQHGIKSAFLEYRNNPLIPVKKVAEFITTAAIHYLLF